MSPYIDLLLILEFFPARLAIHYPMGLIQMLESTSQPVKEAVCILLFWQLYLVILFQYKLSLLLYVNSIKLYPSF